MTVDTLFLTFFRFCISVNSINVLKRKLTRASSMDIMYTTDIALSLFCSAW